MRSLFTLLCGVIISAAFAQPCANFQACFQASGAGPATYFFNNCSTNAGNTQFVWSFGDGEEGTQAATTHTYSAPGQYEVCLTAYLEECVDSTCSVVIVGLDPCVGFDVDLNWTSTPNGVQFSNSTTGAGESTTFAWDFGDGQGSNDAQPSHMYSEPGAYEVCLLAISVFTTNEGLITCTAQQCTLVQVGDIPPCDPNFAVAFAVTNTTGNVVQFVATSNHANTYFNWDFGDGTVGYGSLETHTYPQTGNYSVCVSGWYYSELAQDSCWTEACETIHIAEGPCEGLEACFVTNALQQPATFFFDNCSGAPANAQYLWDFGDGTTSTVTNAEHHFPAPGSYTVCLTTFVQNCADSICTTVIVGNGDPCANLEACFEASALAGNAFFFNNCSSPSLESSFVWHFGDGTTSTSFGPVHTYAEAGTFTVCLVSTWPGGCIDEVCHSITVGNDPCNGLHACFVANELQQPGAFFFDNCSQGPQNIQYHWDFGDGATSTGTNVDHVYSQQGAYTVCLTTYWGNCSDSTCATVVYGSSNPCDALDAGFIASGGLGVNFSNAVVDLSWTYLWNFGDDTDGDGPNPNHDYAEPGTYQVCLVVYTWDPIAQDTCFADHCESITVGGNEFCDELVACFEAQPFENGVYFFENCSQILPIDIPAYYLWDFGDGSTSDNAQPDHAFVPGTYTVCLTVTHGNCVDSICHTITVVQGLGCDPNFAAEFSWTGQETAVVFVGTANRPTNGMNWHFGDGTVGYGNTISHLYEPPGPFEVCLSAWYWNEVEQDTCWTSHCEPIDLFSVGIRGLTPNELGVYPVPARDLIRITGLPANAQLRLFAMDGRLVLSESSNSSIHLLTVMDLAPATYMLRIDVDGRSMHRKVVVE